MVVDLEAKRCACNKWELSGIPCYHACAAIAWSKKSYEDFIHSCYSKTTFIACYQHTLEPISGEEQWQETDYPRPLPPVKKVQTGRPKKVRSKKTDTTPAGATRLKRQNTKVRCSYCTEYSHNLRTCPAKAHDKANGCERKVKRRTKKPKKDDIDDGSTADDGATADDEAKADGGTDDAQTHTPAEGSQGRVFNMQQLGGSTARPSPLGIYPLQFKTRGNATVTSLRNLELARRKREARSKLKPVWKH
ncbi:uncharacterized protein LOC135150743 [Daucus carota subsp. sativus]|uniref:uncharacterized protein LOC135150743 n=1 Tax=Daucus carota subsp. sativus TaxID=79200 RepID=UPI003083C690